MKFGRTSIRQRLRPLSRSYSHGDGAVAFAAAMPLCILALAVTADYAKVSHFKGRVQQRGRCGFRRRRRSGRAAAGHRQRQDVLAGQVADVVFLGHAPRGAGTPTVAVKSGASAVTATVGYAGLAPSNFGAVFGYDAVSADASSTSLARVAEFGRAAR